MQEIHTGSQGAKRQSWEPGNPRPLLLRLAREHPKADADALEKAHLEAIIEAIRDGDFDYVRGLHSYWFGNNLQSALNADPDLKRSFSPPARAAEHKMVDATKADAKAAIAAHIERSAKLVLLDLILPNGKKLRNATGADCKGLAPKMGIWLANIARKVQPNQTVGKILTEKEVRHIYDGA